MLNPIHPRALGAGLLLLSLAALGCNRDRGDAGALSGEPRTVEDSLRVANAQLEQLFAEQDTLMTANKAMVDIMQQIDVAAGDVAGLKAVVGAGPETAPRKEQQVLEKVKMLRQRLDAAEKRVSDSQARLATLSTQGKMAAEEITRLQTSASEQVEQIRNMETRITDLVTEVERLGVKVAQTEQERDVALQQADSLADALHTAFYVIGTRGDLKKQGVLIDEGRWPFKGVRPAPGLDCSRFSRIDTRATTLVDLPADGTYRIVTAHNPRYTDTTTHKDGGFRNTVRILNSDGFWGAGSCLVMERK